ncbi:DUF975 family protein [Streptococcus oricebi]|uniref:Beta-carotene 15,15'-monooxygenase n=1 Tax=Streptococcus oricebi TaxID=1547447 RepID=A0ABS5B5V6_9STRE|nr:DUF975 family protein [Streptococcus oricebi]MBP2624194.1 hypothetical protein [Streptococcus oricebi]
MKKFRLSSLFRQARRELKANYLAWAGPTVCIGLLYGLLISLIYVNYEQIESRSSQPLLASLAYILNLMTTKLVEFSDQPILRVAILLFTASYFFTSKYFLTLVRSPRLVKRYFLEAVQYSITDGLNNRIGYFFLYILTNLPFLLILTVAYLTFPTSFPDLAQGLWLFQWILQACLLLGVILVRSHLFLLPYIVADTCSADNQLAPLPYMECLKKSSQLMKGQFWTYFLLSLAEYGVRLSLEFVQSFIIVHYLVLGQDPASLQLIFILIFLFGLLRFLFINPFLRAVKTIWANHLIVGDREIVNFGD